MTEQAATEPFETHLAVRVRAYSDVATRRRFDALGVARVAMASDRVVGWRSGLPSAGWLSQATSRFRWTAGLAVIAAIGLVAVNLVLRASAPVGGPVPSAIRHTWDRPLPVLPGLDAWGTGFFRLTNDRIEYGPSPGPEASTSAIVASGADELRVTAIGGTRGCVAGAIGVYRWSLTGSDTVMTLTAVGPDTCPEREIALAGSWVRHEPLAPGGGALSWPSTPGTYLTSNFDPIGEPGVSIRLSYTVPEGWIVIEDRATNFVVHRLREATQGEPMPGSLIAVLNQARLAAAPVPGGAVACVPVDDAPGVGGGLDAMVAAIITRPGVVSTPPAAVTIGGREGRLLDLELAAGWTAGCLGPEGLVVGVPILNEAGSGTGPAVGLGSDQPIRLILVKIAEERTMAIVIVDNGGSALFQAHLAEAMPIVESFAFLSPTP